MYAQTHVYTYIDCSRSSFAFFSLSVTFFFLLLLIYGHFANVFLSSIWVSDLIEDCACDWNYIWRTLCIFVCLTTNRNCLFKGKGKGGEGNYFHSLNLVSLSIILPMKKKEKMSNLESKIIRQSFTFITNW